MAKNTYSTGGGGKMGNTGGAGAARPSTHAANVGKSLHSSQDRATGGKKK